MLEKIDHIGVLVNDIEDSREIYELLGLQVGAIEHVSEFGVDIAFIAIGNTLIELIEPVDNTGSIQADLEATSWDSSLHHIAFRVEEIELLLSTLQENGTPLSDKTPRRGAGDAKVAFLERAAANGVRIELVQRDSEIPL